jgi:hypothetical protein
MSSSLHNLKRDLDGQSSKIDTMKQYIQSRVNESNLQEFINVAYIVANIDKISLADLQQRLNDGITLLQEFKKLAQNERKRHETFAQVSNCLTVYNKFYRVIWYTLITVKLYGNKLN